MLSHARQKPVGLCCRLYSTRGTRATRVIRAARQLEPPPEDASLPPLSLWRQHFPPTIKFQPRVTLANPSTAAMVADAFVPAGSSEKVVIEIYPGPGQLTRALLALPKTRIKKLIVLEQADVYLKYLKPLEAVDSRVTIVPLGGEAWSSYQTLETMGLLADIETVPWDQGVHPQLHFVSHLPASVPGEQFISQLFRSMPDQQWLFKYGRVPMSILLSDYIWKRVLGDSLRIRCKLSMIAAAVASFTEAVPSSELQPYAEHFYPLPTLVKQEAKALMARKAGTPFSAINVTPLEHQAIRPGKLIKWDYCLRHLYVNRATPIKNALPYLAPNAQSLLKTLTAPGLEHRLDPKTPVREMTIQDWALLVNAFDEWRFAPEDLSITDTIGIDDEKHG
ncbi:ribosomal RNA adenine dimethylase-domain-containing protein [Mycena polygramma]|nr:ribosomal RNA adenine dimethylase-domain-containing protein [Mycena polygramma]